MIDAFFALGERYPEIAAEMCLVAHAEMKSPHLNKLLGLGDRLKVA